MKPSPQVWERIEAHLARQKRKKRIALFRISAAAAVLLAAGSSALFFTRGSTSFMPDASLTFSGQQVINGTIPLHSATASKPSTVSFAASSPSAAHVSPGILPDFFPPGMNRVMLEELRKMDFPILGSISSHRDLLDQVNAPIAEAKTRRKPREFEFSGDEVHTNRPDHRWMVGGSYSPDIALGGAELPGAAIAKGSAKASSIDTPTALQQQNSFSYTGGVRFAYGVSKNLDVLTGLMYNNRKGVSDANGQFTASTGFAVAQVETNHLYQAFEVPVSLKVNLTPGKKLNYYVSSGISGNFFYRYRAAASTDQPDVNYKQVSNVVTDRVIPSQLNMLISTGLQYKVSSLVSCNLEPGFRYGLVTTDYSFSKNHPLSIGVNAGVNLHF